MEKISVCIVEDVTDIRNALEQIIDLSDECILAGSFANGEDALIAIPSLLPKVVLMDIGLGSTNGIDLVRQLKAQHPEILFMMCTVYEEDEKIFEALRAGASGYILKKSSPAKMIQAIRELVDGGAPMSSLIARKVVEAFKHQPREYSSPDISSGNTYFEELTKKENIILRYLAEGKIYKEIGAELGISPETVRKHVYHIYEKLHVSNRIEAVNRYYSR